MISNIFNCNNSNMYFYTAFGSNSQIMPDKNNVEKEEQQLIDYNFRNLPTTESMDKTDCDNLKQSLLNTSDIKDFIMVSLGVKPASYMSLNNNCNIDRIKSENFDVLKTDDKYNNVYIFNKEETLKNIEKNKEFYIQKMGLPEYTNTTSIYNVLISKDSPLNTTNANFRRNHDLIGVTLGFPLKESVIFQLENMTGLDDEEKRNIPLLKSEIKKTFLTTDLYDNFSNRFKDTIMQSIDSIDRRVISDRSDITYTKYFEENDNNTAERLSKYKKELEKINNLGIQRSMHMNNSANGYGNITDDYLNHILMFEYD